MASKLVVLIGVCLIQVTWTFPQPAETSTSTSAGTGSTSTTAGTKMSMNFNKDLNSILNRNKVSSISTPILKFAVDTMPSLINKGVQMGAEKVAKISQTNMENTQKMASGISKAVGGGVTLGSSVIGGAMDIAGGGVDAAGKVVDTSAQTVLNLLGGMADAGIGGLGTLGTLGEGVLNLAGDGMTAAGGGITVITDGLSNVMKAIGNRMQNSISRAGSTMQRILENRAANISSNVTAAANIAETDIYSIMNNYLAMLTSAQKLFESMATTIAGSGVNLAVSTTGSTSSTT